MTTIYMANGRLMLTCQSWDSTTTDKAGVVPSSMAVIDLTSHIGAIVRQAVEDALAARGQVGEVVDSAGGK